MFFIASKLLAFLSKPIIWIFLLLISLLIFKSKRKKLLYITFFTFYFFTNSFIADSCSRLWEIPRFQPTEKYDVGIVLGGIADYDKITKAHNFNKHADRLMDAEQLYHKGIIKKIMLSGGNGMLFNDGYIEANTMRDHLLQNKIPNKDIIIENTSRNTKENAFNSAIILKQKLPNARVLLITSAQHMKRAQYCFERASIQTTAFPTDCTTSYTNFGIEYIFLPRISAIEVWENLIHEWIGFLVYKITF
ncbi:YdcF family protein [Flavobacteriales bacterium]|nr:YdcF family protein [Flavobacteriales bacterium]